MSKFDSLKSVIATAEADQVKFEAGNGAAGTRLRKAMLDVKKLAQEIRVEVSEKKNSQ